MSITLDWSAGTVPVTEYRIYRSTERFTAGTLPPVYATVAGTVLTFEDKNVTAATLYYYRIAGFKDGKESVSFIKPMAYNPDPGPGPKTILRGDWEYGFFGEMSSNEFASYSKLLDILAQQGFTFDGSSELPTNEWYKFASKGRIIYIHTGTLITAVSWVTMYGLGIAGGGAPESEIPQVVKDTYGIVTKDFKIVLNDRRYRMRLPESRDKWIDTADSDLLRVPGSRRSGEYERTFTRLWYIPDDYAPFPTADRFPNFFITDVSQLGGLGVLCREMFTNDATKIITRPWVHSPDGMKMESASSTSVRARPVFELIQE